MITIRHQLFSIKALPNAACAMVNCRAMLAGAAERGWLDGDRVMIESLMAFKRAGAAGVLAYFAPKVARMSK